MPRQRLTLTDKLALFAVCFLWGTTYLATAEGLEAVHPAMLQGVRFTLGGVVLLTVVLAAGIPLPRKGTDWFRIAVMGVLALAVGIGAISWALQEVESGLAPVIASVMPFLFMGLCAVSGESIPKAAWLGILVGFVGMLVLFWPDLRSLGGRREAVYYFSVGAVLLAAAVWAVATFYARKRPIRAHRLMSIALQNVIAGVVLLAIAAMTGASPPSAIPPKGWVAISYLIVIGTWVSYGSYLYVLERLPPGLISIHSYINPLVAVVLGWIFRDEVLTGWQIGGTAIILLGVFLVNVAERREEFAIGGDPAAADKTGSR